MEHSLPRYPSLHSYLCSCGQGVITLPPTFSGRPFCDWVVLVVSVTFPMTEGIFPEKESAPPPSPFVLAYTTTAAASSAMYSTMQYSPLRHCPPSSPFNQCRCSRQLSSSPSCSAPPPPPPTAVYLLPPSTFGCLRSGPPDRQSGQTPEGEQ